MMHILPASAARSMWCALLLLASCAPRAMPLTADHPANPEAPTGRLAGPPPALRPGVAAEPPPPDQPAEAPAPATPTGHEGHH
ncbi:MAG: hypothetical protein ACTHU0_11035 [Kofleriaceae bacterium]